MLASCAFKVVVRSGPLAGLIGTAGTVFATYAISMRTTFYIVGTLFHYSHMQCLLMFANVLISPETCSIVYENADR